MACNSWMAMLALLAGCHQLFGLTPVDDAPHIDAAPGNDAPPDTALPPGLVRWFPMDALAGTTIPELVDNRFATCDGGTCPTPIEGKRDGALDFDGATYATAPTHPALTAMTIAAWLSVDTLPAPANPYACPLSKPYGTSNSNSWQLCVVESGKFLAVTPGGSVQSSNVVTLGSWVHVALGYSSGTMNLYVDGVVRGTAQVAALAFDDAPIVLGADLNNSQASGRYDGAIDDVQIYDRELTVLELADLMALALP